MCAISPVTFCVFANAFTDILDKFGIHWQLLLIQTLNFSAVVAILYYFAFKPILKTIDARREKIEEGLRYTEKMKQKLDQADILVDNKLSQAKDEARQIIEEARAQAKEYSEKQRLEIDQLTRGMLEESKRTIEEEKAKMVGELKKDVKVLVADVVAKVLSKSLTDEERQKYQSMAEIEL